MSSWHKLLLLTVCTGPACSSWTQAVKTAAGCQKRLSTATWTSSPPATSAGEQLLQGQSSGSSRAEAVSGSPCTRATQAQCEVLCMD